MVLRCSSSGFFLNRFCRSRSLGARRRRVNSARTCERPTGINTVRTATVIATIASTVANVAVNGVSREASAVTPEYARSITNAIGPKE